MFQARLQLERLAIPSSGFGIVAQTFDAFGDFDESAEAGHPQNFALNHVANAMLLEEGLPDIGLKLLHAQRQTTLVRLDRQNDGLHAIALLQNFRGMLHALGPAQIADVNQAINAVFDFDEGAEVGQIANPAFDDHADWEFSCKRVPGIRGQLPHAERDAPLLRVDIEHDALDLIADIDQLRGMLHPLRPGHFADVDQAFDALLEFHKCAVVGHADDASANMRATGIAMLSIEPRIRRQLLEAERNALLVFVELQDLDLDLIAHVHQIRG